MSRVRNPSVTQRFLKGGDVEDLHRIRLGSYRVIYEVWRKQVIVLVLKVGHRREVYR
jgi:mRNA interferase RelE/StbE